MEISYKLNLDYHQLKVLDNHSVLNVLNVVVYELMMFATKVGDETAMDEAIDELQGLADRICNGQFGSQHLDGLVVLKNRLLHKVHQAAEKSNHVDVESIRETLINLRGIFEILEVRVGEMKERLKDPQAWERFSVEGIRGNLIAFFDAVVRNAKGRYGLTYDPARKTEKDYLVDMKITGSEQDREWVWMPPVFQDVIRDLVANARKYTDPGGALKIHVSQTEGELLIEISDTGIGIPEDEIPEILGFGFRASNTGNRTTMGGGFGLTKAFYLTQMFGGKMWIDSKMGEASGTSIRISLPISNVARSDVNVNA